MKKVFELPVVEIFELSSDEIMENSPNSLITSDKVDYPILEEEDSSAADNF